MSAERGLPPHLDPRNRERAGIEVLDQGLPALPEVLTYQMSVPLAFWKATSCAVVLFLKYSHLDDRFYYPGVRIGSFYRDGDRWAAQRWWAGTGWSYDPVTDPGGLRDLGGQAIAQGGGRHDPDAEPGWPASVITGRVSPAVTHLALVQDGREERRELQSHFGAWVVCTDKWSPYQVNALDETGAVMGHITGPPPISRTEPPDL